MPRKEVNWTLKNIGFEKDHSETTYDRFTGVLNCHGKNIPVSVEVHDYNFVSPPIIRIDKSVEGLPPGTAHLSINKGLCYTGGAKSPVFDLYKPGGSILLALDEARSTLEDVFANKTTDDVQQEFSSYWSMDGHSEIAFVSVPKETFEGYCKYLTVLDKRSSFAIATTKNKLVKFYEQVSQERKEGKFTLGRAYVLNTKSQAKVGSGTWPPMNLYETINWLYEIDPTLVPKIKR